MWVALVFMGVVMVLWDHVWRKRIVELERAVVIAGWRLDAQTSQEAWNLRYGIRESDVAMHNMVLVARSRGNLDQANKLMELQRWADCDYDAEWLDGMFRGFP